jgi:hypothetical protein
VQIDHERRQFVAPKLLAKHYMATPIYTVDLEHILGQVDSNRLNRHGKAPLFRSWSALPLWHISTYSGGGVHPIDSLRSSKSGQLVRRFPARPDADLNNQRRLELGHIPHQSRQVSADFHQFIVRYFEHQFVVNLQNEA